MNRNEVNSLLYEIRGKCNRDNAEEYLSLIEDIYKIKPVTTLYFNVNAKLLCLLGKYEEAIEFLTATTNLILPEEEHIETCEIYKQAFKGLGNDSLSKQWMCMGNYIRYILNNDIDAFNNIKILGQEVESLENKFMNSLNANEIAIALANAYYESWYSVEGTVMYALSLKNNKSAYKNTAFYNERIAFEVNHTFLLERLINDNGTYILLTNDEDYFRTMVIGKALTLLNNKVFIIMPSISTTVEYEIDIKETVKISMDNIEIDSNGMVKIRPLKILLNGKIFGSNIDLLLEELVKDTENDFSIVIGSSQIFANVNDMPKIKKRMQRLSQIRTDLLEGSFIFGYFGSYTSYISKIYDLDVEEELSKPNECEFSIVIPVRNSVESLRYTLKTCLEQRGMSDNSYEIVISDNSYPDYMEVEKLVKAINDPKIKYYRTPRDLTLGRSFEYAFIKAKGEFIFSIGADDAVLPWGLETLKYVLSKLPDDDVLQWDRGFYVWSDNYKVKNQLGQFLIPKNYNKFNFKIDEKSSIETIINVLTNPSLMYGLPMLYINSGFRRRYLNKLLKYTGRLWDGLSQDVYIGVINLLVNKKIPYLEYPITIAGMTMNSVGINANQGEIDIKMILQKQVIEMSRYGMAIPSGSGCKFMPISLDIGNLYFIFFRVLDIDDSGQFDLIYNKINWKEVFKNIIKMINYNDLRLDYDIKLVRYSAYRQSDEFGKWFDDNLLQFVLEPKIMTKIEEKTYFEGFLSNGGLQLDATKFNVTNIYEATKLFENICNL